MPASKAEQVLEAFKALLETVPDALVERNSVLPEKVPAGGLIILRDGDPGEPEEALGGFGSTYYQHTVEIEIYVEEGDAAVRGAAFDALLQQIGVALEADPTSGTTPNLRHQASGGGTVTITSSVAIVNDATWSTIVGTWRPGRLELYVDGFSRASSTAAATSTSALFGIYRWGWGFSTSQDFNGDIALVACFASSWTPAMVRRWHADPFGFLRPWNELPALMGSAPPATPPSTGTGVVTFLMA